MGVGFLIPSLLHRASQSAYHIRPVARSFCHPCTTHGLEIPSDTSRSPLHLVFSELLHLVVTPLSSHRPVDSPRRIGCRVFYCGFRRACGEHYSCFWREVSNLRFSCSSHPPASLRSLRQWIGWQATAVWRSWVCSTCSTRDES